MTSVRPARARCLGSLALGSLVAATLSSFTGLVSAQPASPPDGVTIGEFWFRPSIEQRTRGEYAYRPAVTSDTEQPVLGSTLGAARSVRNQWVVHARSRLGLSVERGMLSATVLIQDARLAGSPSPASVDRGSTEPTTSFHLAFVEVRTPEIVPSFVRIGRQEIVWGDGRLLGVSDWALTPRSFDAARGRWVLRQFDIEGLAALLSAPGAIPPEYAGPAAIPGASDSGTGAELYGVRVTGHLDPLLQPELSGLARIARRPLPSTLTPSDTVALDGRIQGERAALSYTAEAVYELGNLATIGGTQKVSAWAATAHLDFQTEVLFRPKVSLSGSYASGGEGKAGGPTHRFDPLFPDSRNGLGQMGLYAWSNVLDVVFNLTMAPADGLSLALAYRHVRLADPHGAWFSASLLPIGQSPTNNASFLGHEIDASLAFSPVEALTLSGGYGAFVTGDAARSILGPSSRLLSAAYLQVRVAAP